MSEKKTKEQLLEEYGEPSSEGNTSNSFFSRSYKEDCALMGGLRDRADLRLEWNTSSGSKVVYFKNNIVIAEF